MANAVREGWGMYHRITKEKQDRMEGLKTFDKEVGEFQERIKRGEDILHDEFMFPFNKPVETIPFYNTKERDYMEQKYEETLKLYAPRVVQMVEQRRLNNPNE